MVSVTERGLIWSPDVHNDHNEGIDYIMGWFHFEPRGLAPSMWCKVSTSNDGYVSEIQNDHIAEVQNEMERRKHSTLKDAIDYCELRLKHYIMLVNADYPALMLNYDARQERGGEMRGEFERIKSGLRLAQG